MKRNYSIDLLRIISIFFVVCVHYVGWGGLASTSDVSKINFVFAGGISLACNIGVNCFYLITGYCASDNLSFDDSKKRIKKIWESTLFYSIVIPLFLHFIDNVDLSIMMALPVLSNQYWFSTTYICMMLIFPFFIKAAKKCDKKQLKQLVLSLLFIDVVQPIFGYNAFSNIGYGLIHALTMITVGYYLKKENIRLSNWKAVGMYIGSIIMIGIIIIISIAVTGDRNRTIADYNSIFMVLASVGFFLLFLNIKVKTDIFMRISPYVFGVYLLNDNAHARDFLWKKVLCCDEFYNSVWMPIHFLCVTIGFVFFALLIEYIRIRVVNKLKNIYKNRRMNYE